MFIARTLPGAPCAPLRHLRSRSHPSFAPAPQGPRWSRAAEITSRSAADSVVGLAGDAEKQCPSPRPQRRKSPALAGVHDQAPPILKAKIAAGGDDHRRDRAVYEAGCAYRRERRVHGRRHELRKEPWLSQTPLSRRRWPMRLMAARSGLCGDGGFLRWRRWGRGLHGPEESPHGGQHLQRRDRGARDSRDLVRDNTVRPCCIIRISPPPPAWPTRSHEWGGLRHPLVDSANDIDVLPAAYRGRDVAFIAELGQIEYGARHAGARAVVVNERTAPSSPPDGPPPKVAISSMGRWDHQRQLQRRREPTGVSAAAADRRRAGAPGTDTNEAAGGGFQTINELPTIERRLRRGAQRSRRVHARDGWMAIPSRRSSARRAPASRALL